MTITHTVVATHTSRTLDPSSAFVHTSAGLTTVYLQQRFAQPHPSAEQCGSVLADREPVVRLSPLHHPRHQTKASGTTSDRGILTSHQSSVWLVLLSQCQLSRLAGCFVHGGSAFGARARWASSHMSIERHKGLRLISSKRLRQRPHMRPCLPLK